MYVSKKMYKDKYSLKGIEMRIEQKQWYWSFQRVKDNEMFIVEINAKWQKTLIIKIRPIAKKNYWLGNSILKLGLHFYNESSNESKIFNKFGCCPLYFDFTCN